MEPTMSQFATREQCLEARVEFYKNQRDELLAAIKRAHIACMDARPKQAVGELLSAAIAKVEQS